MKNWKHLKKIAFGVTLAAGAAVFVNCGSGVRGSTEYPAVAPIVASALPTALRPTTTAMLMRKLQSFGLFGEAVAAGSDLKTDIQKIYLGTFGKLSGGNGQGWLNALLEDMDSRLSELQARGPFGCENSEMKTISLDVSTIAGWSNTDFNFSIPARCYDTLSTPYGKSGYLIWGREGTTIGIWLFLPGQATNSGFGYAAKVTNYGADNEKVEMLYVENQAPSGNYRVITSRINAERRQNKYEIVFAGNWPGAISALSGSYSGNTTIGCFFQLKSDGSQVNISAKRKASGSDCTSLSSAEAACFDGSSLSEVGTNTGCSGAGTTFSLSSSGASSSLDSLVGSGSSLDADGTALYTLISGASAITQLQSAGSNSGGSGG